ncbi:hypothetical protein WJX81_003141 [Elliptochloris bilobata]|uniref:Uncharacterized protein n=1 Tax=Elliptochloris bilobata TaxID=381761 RepID=A0AAW1RN38_9CHLO
MELRPANLLYVTDPAEAAVGQDAPLATGSVQYSATQLEDWLGGARGRPRGLAACLRCSAPPQAPHANLLLLQGPDEDPGAASAAGPAVDGPPFDVPISALLSWDPTGQWLAVAALPAPNYIGVIGVSSGNGSGHGSGRAIQPRQRTVTVMEEPSAFPGGERPGTELPELPPSTGHAGSGGAAGERGVAAAFHRKFPGQRRRTVTILEASYEEDADGWPDMALMGYPALDAGLACSNPNQGYSAPGEPLGGPFVQQPGGQHRLWSTARHQVAGRKSYPNLSSSPASDRRTASVLAAVHSSAARLVDLRRAISMPASASYSGGERVPAWLAELAGGDPGWGEVTTEQLERERDLSRGMLRRASVLPRPSVLDQVLERWRNQESVIDMVQREPADVAGLLQALRGVEALALAVREDTLASRQLMEASIQEQARRTSA